MASAQLNNFAFKAQRGTNEQNRLQIAAGFHNSLQRHDNSIQQRVLMKQVIVGVSRNTEFRKERESGVLLAGALRQTDSMFGIKKRIGDTHVRHANGGAHHAV
jgi:hypothetical protein